MLLGAFSRVCDGSVEDAGPWTQTHSESKGIALSVGCSVWSQRRKGTEA